MHVQQDELGHLRGVAVGVGSLAEQVVQRLLPVPGDHHVVHLGDDAVLAEGAHRERDLVPVVLDEQYGLLAHAVAEGIMRRRTRHASKKESAHALAWALSVA